MSEEIPDKTKISDGALAPGGMVNHYRIVEKIGAGGMGEVFLAEDTKLERQIALKFLPAHLIASEELLQRFYREAKAVARLNHPNIVTVHDVGDAGGTPYLVMEYVSGQTLQVSGVTTFRSINEILGLALQICQGLAEAHRNGIVHRDIKPSNIIVDESGRVRILDFGLAALAGSDELTKAGTALGTIAYMSPEQVSGRNLDRRSDLFSFGILLYEMLTGKNPFKGNNEGATLRAIMDSNPEPISKTRSDVPEPLQRVVMKALEKNLEMRYQSCEDIIADLKKLLHDSQSSGANAARANTDKTLVVVPFANLSADAENEYFSDGLTEEIITDLASIGRLRVISRSSSNMLKGTQKSARTIGVELGVRYILTGSVRKAGNSVRITAQLVEAASDSQIWADKYSGTLDDIFAMQERVSRAIVDALKVELSGSEKEQLAAHAIVDVRAYEYYLRARQDIHTWNETALTRAESYLNAGLEIIGENALLYAALAWVYAQLVNIGARQDEWIEKARVFANKALELAPTSSEAYHIRGLIASYFEGSVLKALECQRQALKFNPADSDALFELAFDSAMIGRMDEARALEVQLRSIDPLTQKADAVKSWILLLNGQFQEHLELRLRMLEAEPDRLIRRTWVAASYLYVGDTTSAEKAMLGVELAGFAARLTKTLVLASCGRREEALALVTDDLERTALRDPQFSLHLAEAFALAGQIGRALATLEQAVSRGFWNFRFLETNDPFFEPLRGLPRFQKILETVKRKTEDNTV